MPLPPTPPHLEGSVCQRYKMALFDYRKSVKGTSDLINPCP